MNCIFCQRESRSAKTVEHIIPESLGNKNHVLPCGWVCDGCNNYFSIKIEKPFLESLYLTGARFHMAVPNKRGNIPSILGYHPQARAKVEIRHMPNGEGLSVGAARESDEARWAESVKNSARGTLYIPHTPMPEIGSTLARFVGKMGLEVLAFRFVKEPGGNQEIASKPELGGLRNFVRWNRGCHEWPVSVRRIYPADFLFCEHAREPFEVLHEFDLMVTEDREFYAVIVIFGIEYAINLGGPELEGYKKWLVNHDHKSPLYVGKNINPMLSVFPQGTQYSPFLQ